MFVIKTLFFVGHDLNDAVFKDLYAEVAQGLGKYQRRGYALWPGDSLDHNVLRAYDAVQLASALVVNKLMTNANLAPLTFVCADSNLLAAARTAGLLVDNPNLHA